MTRPSSHRWLRIDAAWPESEWLLPLPPAAKLAWIRLLCDVKIYGVRGRMKNWRAAVLARRWEIPVEDVAAMLSAAVDDGALGVEDEEYVVVHWNKYQDVDTLAADRMRRKRLRDSEIDHSYGVTDRNDVTLRHVRRNPSRDGDGDVDGDVDSSAVQARQESVPPTPQPPPTADRPTAQEAEDRHVGDRLNDLWRQHKLRTPKGYDWLHGAAKVTALTQWWTDEQILSAPAKITATPDLEWAGRKGPAYLASKTKAGVYVLEEVLTWEDLPAKDRPGRNGQPSDGDAGAVLDEIKRRYREDVARAQGDQP